jgi:colicin import membrane protein/protein TonB
MRRIPVATALSRRDRMWPAVAASVAAHAVLVAVGMLRAPVAPIDLEQKPIVAKLVRIGEKKPEHYLPRKDAAPQPAPAAPAAVPVLAAPAAPAAPAAKPEAKPAPAKPQPAAPVRGSGTTLASVLSKVEREVADERWGAPDGDAMGDSDEGEEGDRYLALVDRELKANYRVPATIPERERLYLKAVVVLFIERDGRLSRWKMVTPSGNPTFDAAVERTLESKSRLPPPPDHIRARYPNGMAIAFTANS